jgi:hypothetical protein
MGPHRELTLFLGSNLECPGSDICVEFGGTAACAPNDHDWCALNPDTFEAVGCKGGTCCHGQCYTQGVTCCTNNAVQCTLGATCNVCPPGVACGSNGCAGVTTTTKTTTSSKTPTIPVSLPPITTTSSQAATTTKSASKTTTSLVVTITEKTTSTASTQAPGQQPTAVPTVGNFTLQGCFPDDPSNRVLPNGTLVANNMTAEVCVKFASDNVWQFAGVENGDECYVGNSLSLSLPSSGCTTVCAGSPSEICGGKLQFNLYQDEHWVTPSKQALEDAVADLLSVLEQFQEALGDWMDSIILYNSENSNSTDSDEQLEARADNPDDGDNTTPGQVQQFASTALNWGNQLLQRGNMVHRQLQGAVAQRVIDRAEYIELESLTSDTISDTESTVSDVSRAASESTDSVPDTLVHDAAQAIERVGAPELPADAAGGISTGVAATGLFAAWKVFKALVDAIGPDDGTGGTATLPLPTSVSASQTQTVTSATGKPTSTSTPAEPLANVVMFNQKMTKYIYNVIKAAVIIGGGEILEDMADSTVSWWAFYALLTDDQAFTFANVFPLTEVITPPTPSHDLDDESGVVLPSESASSGSTQGTIALNATSRRRSFADNDPGIKISDAAGEQPDDFGANDIEYYPFHLQWFSNLWAKTGLTGLCKCIWTALMWRGTAYRPRRRSAASPTS